MTHSTFQADNMTTTCKYQVAEIDTCCLPKALFAEYEIVVLLTMLL